MNDVALFRHSLFSLMYGSPRPSWKNWDRKATASAAKVRRCRGNFLYLCQQTWGNKISWPGPCTKELKIRGGSFGMPWKAGNLGMDYSFSIRLRQDQQIYRKLRCDQWKRTNSVWLYFNANRMGKRVTPPKLLKKWWTCLEGSLQSFGSERLSMSIIPHRSSVLKKSGLIEEARLSRWYRFVNQNNQPKGLYTISFSLVAFLESWDQYL